MKGAAYSANPMGHFLCASLCPHPLFHTQDKSGVYSRVALLAPAFRDSIHPYRQPPSSQSQVYWVTQLRTHGVRHQESVGTEPVVIEVVGVKGAAYSRNPMDQYLCASLFTHSLFVHTVDTCDTDNSIGIGGVISVCFPGCTKTSERLYVRGNTVKQTAYMNVWMVMTCSRLWINRVRLPIPQVASSTGKMDILLSPFAPETLVSHETGSAVPSRVSLLILHTQAESDSRVLPLQHSKDVLVVFLGGSDRSQTMVYPNQQRKGGETASGQGPEPPSYINSNTSVEVHVVQ